MKTGKYFFYSGENKEVATATIPMDRYNQLLEKEKILDGVNENDIVSSFSVYGYEVKHASNNVYFLSHNEALELLNKELEKTKQEFSDFITLARSIRISGIFSGKSIIGIILKHKQKQSQKK